jgi:hypothetical protein
MRRRLDDDLLRPSLQDVAPIRALEPGDRPWRLGSMFYVAFFGGALAVAALAWENSRRLGTPPDRRRWVFWLGVAGVVASIVVSYLLYGNDYSSAARLGYRLVGALTFGALYRLLKPDDRLYTFRSPSAHEDDYDSLWGPGLLAIFAGGLVQLGLVFGGMAIIHSAVGS